MPIKIAFIPEWSTSIPTLIYHSIIFQVSVWTFISSQQLILFSPCFFPNTKIKGDSSILSKWVPSCKPLDQVSMNGIDKFSSMQFSTLWFFPICIFRMYQDFIWIESSLYTCILYILTRPIWVRSFPIVFQFSFFLSTLSSKLIFLSKFFDQSGNFVH